jgi:hypothetical protein
MTPHLTPPFPAQIGKACTKQNPIEYSIEDADIRALKYLADNLRDEDTAELYAASGKANWPVLLRGMGQSDILKIGYADSVPFVVWGTVPAETGALIWMVGTNGIVQHSKEFLRRSRALRDELHAAHPLLWNYADVRNTIHHRWLQWLDFKFIRKVPYGFEQRPFYEFGRLAHV